MIEVLLSLSAWPTSEKSGHVANFSKIQVQKRDSGVISNTVLQHSNPLTGENPLPLYTTRPGSRNGASYPAGPS